MKKNLPAFLSLFVYLLFIFGIERLGYLEFKEAQSSFRFGNYFLILGILWPFVALLTLLYQWIIYEKFPANKGYHFFQIALGAIWFSLFYFSWNGSMFKAISQIIRELSMSRTGIFNAVFAFIGGLGVIGLLRDNAEEK